MNALSDPLGKYDPPKWEAVHIEKDLRTEDLDGRAIVPFTKVTYQLSKMAMAILGGEKSDERPS